MSREEIEAKFRGNASLALPDEQVRDIVRHTATLDALPRLDPLIASLTA
jgi:hypothetical protein